MCRVLICVGLLVLVSTTLLADESEISHQAEIGRYALIQSHSQLPSANGVIPKGKRFDNSLVKKGKSYFEREKEEVMLRELERFSRDRLLDESELEHLIKSGQYGEAAHLYALLLKSGRFSHDMKRYGEILAEKGVLCAEQKREMVMASELTKFSQTEAEAKGITEKGPYQESTLQKEVRGEEREKAQKKSRVKISGRIRMGVGVNSDGDILWKWTNPDKDSVPYEKSWRYLWGEEREDTFDPKVYDKLEVNLKSEVGENSDFFAQLVWDPWSYVGDVDAHIQASAGGDEADVRLKYIFATGRTLNEIFRTKYGNILNFDEIKVVDGKLSPYTPRGLYDWYTYFDPIGGEEIHGRWNILRKLYWEWQGDLFSLKVFPLSDQYEALKSDDLLRLSDNRKEWEESPWIDTYEPSRVFERNGNPVKAGKWVRNISAYVRDSEWNRLTYLRGLSVGFDNGILEGENTVALPMTLWDDYSDINSLDAASRWKVYLESFPDGYIGLLYTGKRGFDDEEDLEAKNDLLAVDLYLPFSDFLFRSEIAYSNTEIDEANGYKTDFDGYGYGVSLSYSPNKQSHTGVYFYYLDDTFSPGLSNYRYTCEEEERSKHLYFDEADEEEVPEDYYIDYGDGLERGWSTLGIYSVGKSWGWDYDFFFRHVFSDTGKHIETLTRAELSRDLTQQVRIKGLVWYKFLPDTQKGKDPLIRADSVYALSDYYSGQNNLLQNNSIEAGKDPSIGHYSVGAKWKPNDIFSLQGIWERTNDPMNFPRLLYYDIYVTDEQRDGVLWDAMVPFLYDQDIFGLPPYEYYDIYKIKSCIRPISWFECRLSYTKNEDKFATGIDDNVNHVGLDLLFYLPKNITLWGNYTFSRMYDLYRYNKEGILDYGSHHNFFVGLRWSISKDEYLDLMWGEYAGYMSDSYWHLSAVDTQHIFRLVYEKKF